MSEAPRTCRPNWFKTAAGIDFTIVPFRGTPEVQISLLQDMR